MQVDRGMYENELERKRIVLYRLRNIDKHRQNITNANAQKRDKKQAQVKMFVQIKISIHTQLTFSQALILTYE